MLVFMIRDLPISSPVTPDADSAPFRILALCDSEQSAGAAARAAAVVLWELGGDIKVEKNGWSVESLRSNEASQEAAAAAARADIILVAVESAVPMELIKEWVLRWEKKREAETGLLVFIPADDAEFTPLEEFLYEVAVTAHMDFLSRRRRY